MRFEIKAPGYGCDNCVKIFLQRVKSNGKGVMNYEL